MKDSEKKRILELKKGNKKALKSLYEAYSVQVFNLAYRMTSNREDAEEIVQDTFIRLWKSRQKVDEDAKILGYIIVIARNIAIDMLRARQKRSGLDVYPSQMFSKLSDTNNFYFEEAGRQFDAAVANLPSKRREVFILKIHTDLTNKQIASKLNISETMVERQIRLASDAVRAEMDKE